MIFASDNDLAISSSKNYSVLLDGRPIAYFLLRAGNFLKGSHSASMKDIIFCQGREKPG